MIINDAVNLFIKKGFHYAKGNIPNVYIFLKQSSEAELDLCILINNTDKEYINAEILNNLCDSLQRKFLFNGFRKVNPFYIIMSDNVEREKIFLSQPYHFWILDTIGKRVMIFDNQPENYYDMKDDFESLLSPSIQPPGLRKTMPIVTISLVAINIIIFIIMTFSGGTDNSYYMLTHGGAYWKFIYEDHEYYRLFTCMFLHFNGEHIMNNMITLAFIGAATEKFLGHIRFFCIYILSGLGASVVSSLYYMHNSPDTVIVSAGASGAIFGILGSLIIATLMSKELRKNINPLNILIIAILSISNGYLSSSIDNVAHIGGLLFGIILTFISCLYRKNILK